MYVQHTLDTHTQCLRTFLYHRKGLITLYMLNYDDTIKLHNSIKCFPRFQYQYKKVTSTVLDHYLHNSQQSRLTSPESTRPPACSR